MTPSGVTVVPLHLADRSNHFAQSISTTSSSGRRCDRCGERRLRVTTTMLMHERAAVGRGWDYGKERTRQAEHSRSRLRSSTSSPGGSVIDQHVRQIIGEVWVLDALFT